MSESQSLYELLFNDGESVCVSDDEFGYHSVPVADLGNSVVELVSPNPKVETKIVPTSELRLVALNPIQGFRRDENCTAFRSFMVELDSGQLKSQLDYIKELGLPYSACVFSGNKSLHFAVTLDSDLPNEDTWRYYQQWMLNICDRADPNTKNPSRSLRVPGPRRGDRKQTLVEMRSRIAVASLDAWLSQFSGFRPMPRQKSQGLQVPTPEALSPWVIRELTQGIDFSQGRNSRWFAIGFDFGRAGYNEHDIEAVLEPYFSEERDFRRYEWRQAIKSGCRKGGQGNE